MNPMKEALTVRQEEILNLIREHIQDTGLPPTRMEICDRLGFRSPNAAEDHLRTLERKGYIEMLPGMSRGIVLVAAAGVPVVGRVAAGAPILAEQNITRHYDLDPRLFRPRAHYLLKVQGLSMRDAGILDGDLLAVHRTREVRKGQIVVARLGDEVTVKRFERKRNQVHLLPENPEFEPIVVDLNRQELVIEGLAVGVIRNGKFF